MWALVAYLHSGEGHSHSHNSSVNEEMIDENHENHEDHNHE
jgi:hypothetical protein